MTQHSQNGEGVEVIQSDRDCAASMIALTHIKRDIKAGLRDDHAAVAAVARYRQSLTAREPATADVGREGQAREVLARQMVEPHLAARIREGGEINNGVFIRPSQAIAALLAFDHEAALSRAAPSSGPNP